MKEITSVPELWLECYYGNVAIRGDRTGGLNQGRGRGHKVEEQWGILLFF